MPAERPGFADGLLDRNVDGVQSRHQIALHGQTTIREQLTERLLRLLHELEQSATVGQSHHGHRLAAMVHDMDLLTARELYGYRRTAYRFEQPPHQPLFQGRRHVSSRCLPS
jgi:hypothetical protein